jgi:hypothetical protein
MTRIDSTARIAELIRRQADALREAARRPAPAAGGEADAAPGGVAARLGEVIARRIRSIDADDPQRRQKAFRIFLESVLLAELGESLINDAGFYQLAEQVQQQMASDADLQRAMDDAADRLLGAGKGSQSPG